MALAALVLMYSLGRALWNTLTLGLQMPCTDVTVLQLLLGASLVALIPGVPGEKSVS